MINHEIEAVVDFHLFLNASIIGYVILLSMTNLMFTFLEAFAPTQPVLVLIEDLNSLVPLVSLHALLECSVRHALNILPDGHLSKVVQVQ